MNVQTLLALVRESRPNALSNSTLLDALNGIEGRVQTELLGMDAAAAVRYGAVNKAELLLLPPYDRLYLYAMMSEVDYLLGEASLYQNDKTRADEAWEDLRLLLCRRGRCALFGGLLCLRAGCDVTLALGGLALGAEEVSSIAVTFTALEESALTKTEDDDGVEVSGSVLLVPLSADESSELDGSGVVTVSAVLESGDGAETRSETIRLLIKEEA